MSIKVTPILGVVAVMSGGELSPEKPAANNTRWMFDVGGAMDEPLILQLVEMRTGRNLTPDLLSCAFLPKSASFYDARPFLYEQVGGLVTIDHMSSVIADADRMEGRKDRASVSCFYRVMIDVLHTATR